MSRAIDITGKRFGKVTAVALVESVNGRRRWDCLCDCGKLLVVQQNNLQSGNTTSCGCSHIGKKMPNRKKPRRDLGRLGMKPRHGHACGYKKTSEYGTWFAIIARCFDENCPAYPRYGGRGIRMCDGWRASFESFLESMGTKPSPDLSIDRIDNERGYDCGRCDDCLARNASANCRWATRKEQSRNMRSNHMITYNNETLPICDWAERLGIRVGVLHHRIGRGWSIDDALSRSVQTRAMPTPSVEPSMRFNLMVTA